MVCVQLKKHTVSLLHDRVDKIILGSVVNKSLQEKFMV